MQENEQGARRPVDSRLIPFSALSREQLQLRLREVREALEDLFEREAEICEALRKRLPSVEPGRCSLCGCTDEMACPGGCFWADNEHTVCSNCDGSRGGGLEVTP